MAKKIDKNIEKENLKGPNHEKIMAGIFAQFRPI
jgi:hypothetical protein